ncbi:hypothetical protein BWZ81_004393 [Escherichia coli]|nr:hypothetical protein [Escherichia coli]HCD6152386.1 hypothetical protein [Escherichia coli]HCD6876727.1 hypothetical protein [Escherichia coli]
MADKSEKKKETTNKSAKKNTNEEERKINSSKRHRTKTSECRSSYKIETNSSTCP